MPRTKGRTKQNIEARWYDVFSNWPKADREAALKVLGALHRCLPEFPRSRLGKITIGPNDLTQHPADHDEEQLPL